ncbi:outer membrane protein assembly factor BamA [Propionivibrio dicarboxylicus]|uniref:Outer membrane protein assembly factor BamA n=1 Tax=Propionivibrio dicarboxylicus TaxID=83767 RepID=A0A1G8DAI5_9RHOO|nr:outer membrane protein assembly factor BamA [Propionivibrio dicarboxylicus]SDH54603.1 Beta-barrel assembly machine subunit BamA [Propionivibrio dicarboxylicus]
MKKILLSGLVAALFATGAYAFDPFTVKDIRVEGLQRTEAGTVFSYLPVKVGETMTNEKASQAIKALFATGFFKDVRIEVMGGVVNVIIEERPAIAQIDFVGLKEFDKEQILKGLKEVGFAVSRSFDRGMLDKAEQELKRQYLTRGKYAASITTTITPLERNRVAINFKIDEGDSAKIRQINIVGAQSFKEKLLLDEFQLQTPNWISWYTKNDQYSKQKLSADLESLRSFYLNRGYLEFNIESTQVSISPDKKDVYISVSVNEGERYVVSSVKLAGDLTLPEDELRKAVQIKPGDIFSREKLNESTKAISDKLSAKGYAFANVNAAPEIDKEKHQVAFTIFVDPGKRVYVRRITISGNTKTRDEVIRQEMRQMEGAWYDDERVKLSKQRIDKTTYFSEVNVETPPVPGTTDQVDVNVNVTERSTGSISAGLGYSQAEGVIVQGAIAQSNIFGSGKFASIQLNTGRLNRTIGFSYTNPYFTVDGISQGFDIYHNKYNPISLGYAYRKETTGAGIRFGLPIGEKETLTFGAGADYTTVNIDRSDANTPLQYIHFADKFCGGSSTCSNTSYPFSTGWIRDSKDSVINPTKGGIARVGYEISPVGDIKYNKIVFQRQHYFAITRNTVLMINGEVGFAKGLGGQDLPYYKNFYAGGPSTVRGYDTASLGPYEYGTNGIVRLGGVRRVLFNSELTVPLSELGFGKDKSVRFGPFFDAGQVYGDKSANQVAGVVAEGPIRMSTGVALTWTSPFGPLRFSLAQPINRQENDKIQRFQFQMGQTF